MPLYSNARSSSIAAVSGAGAPCSAASASATSCAPSPATPSASISVGVSYKPSEPSSSLCEFDRRRRGEALADPDRAARRKRRRLRRVDGPAWLEPVDRGGLGEAWLAAGIVDGLELHLVDHTLRPHVVCLRPRLREGFGIAADESVQATPVSRLKSTLQGDIDLADGDDLFALGLNRAAGSRVVLDRQPQIVPRVPPVPEARDRFWLECLELRPQVSTAVQPMERPATVRSARRDQVDVRTRSPCP